MADDNNMGRPTAVRFPNGPVRVIPVPRQEPNNNQMRKQPPLTKEELDSQFDELSAEYREKYSDFVALSNSAKSYPRDLKDVPTHTCVEYRLLLSNLITKENECKKILEVIAGLLRIHYGARNPNLKADYDILDKDVKKNTILIKYVDEVIASRGLDFPMNGGKTKRKNKRKTRVKRKN